MLFDLLRLPLFYPQTMTKTRQQLSEDKKKKKRREQKKLSMRRAREKLKKEPLALEER